MGSMVHESGKTLLAALATKIPGLPLITPTSPDYKSLRETYELSNQAVPLAIVRPRSAEDIAAVIPLAHSHGIKLSVRSGGHDVFGRSIVDGAIVIDMRPLDSISVSEDKKTVTIGGGIIMGTLIEELVKFELVTPFGSVPSVGYVGWATNGGYGALSAKHGLGVDQIVGAKVANWKGELVDADAEMLKGIRGAGGNFGVVVEMTIKVYSLKSVSQGCSLPTIMAPLADVTKAPRRDNYL
jgi:FAD/FMN-containing dehydrogenase